MRLPLSAFLALLKLSGRRKRFESVEGLYEAIDRERRTADAAPPRALHARFDIEHAVVEGSVCYTLRPRANPSGVNLLYLHGGAHVAEMSPHHWHLVAELVALSGCTAHVPIYPLAPDFNHADAFRVVLAIYRERFQKLASEHIVLMGDSSGGGLALALAQQLNAWRLPQPRDIALISPWLDLTMSDPMLASLESQDPWLAIPGLAEAARLWCGGAALDDPIVSPLNGSLDALGRISVFIGGKDLLMADCLRLRERARAQSAALQWFEQPKMIHVWPLLPLRAAKPARRQLAALLQAA